ncbi:MAG TPA: response regulator [Pyrinomonadaceae bacterium]|nr:response regulator [Pyrinomonadaceae bacterium]
MRPLVKRRVLCAEPHEDTCRLIISLLAQEGHEVKSAGSVRDCLELARGEHFDLYMIDDDYIDGTSIELCRKLRALNPATPILFFSSAAFERDRQLAFEAGAHSYLTKPNDIFEIVHTVNSIFRGVSAGASKDADLS